jgi:hypothetical protein
MTEPDYHGTFTNGDRQQIAYTVDDVVQLKFDGWTQVAADEAEPAPTPDLAAPVPPPMGGEGSGIEAWREYAAKLDVDIPDDVTKRQDVVDLVKAAGHPTEPPAE